MGVAVQVGNIVTKKDRPLLLGKVLSLDAKKAWVKWATQEIKPYSVSSLKIAPDPRLNLKYLIRTYRWLKFKKLTESVYLVLHYKNENQKMVYSTSLFNINKVKGKIYDTLIISEVYKEANNYYNNYSAINIF